MAHLIDKDALVELRQKVQDALLKSTIDYYEAERACCKMAAPQQWKDDRKKAFDEFIWRCQDYQIVNESDNIDLEELNYNYLWKHYIDKSALVAEIERRKEKYITERLKAETINAKNILGARIAMLEEIKVFLNTLEVKEVDLTEEDMKLVWNLGDEISAMSEDEFFKELLRRYKAKKRKNI